MRGLGLIGLVLALLVVGVLAKKQLAGTQAIAVPPAASATSEPPAPQGQVGNVREQSQQLQQQYQQALDAAMQPRPLPGEAQ